MSMMMLVIKACRCAVFWHSGQRRKGDATEPCRNRIAEVTEDSDFNLIPAAIHHDAIEAGGIGREVLIADFADDIANLGVEVTVDKSLPGAKRKQLQVELMSSKSPRAGLLKIADATSHLRAILKLSPVDECCQRKPDHLTWIEAVIARAMGKNTRLERIFDDPANVRELVISPPGIWTVYVDDNFHFMNEDERYVLGTFESYEAAVAACRRIVDDFLRRSNAKTADELFDLYAIFGEDPWIKGSTA